MIVPRKQIEAARGRLDFKPEDRAGATVRELNSAEQLGKWVAGPGAKRAIAEGTLERIIDQNDLLPINYLERGLTAARAVGRISIHDESGRVEAYGTGFMISPRLLLTNHHVLPDARTAASATIEFNYQLDAAGKKTSSDEFALDPDACYFTDETLDFAVVAVGANVSGTKARLADFGFLPLDATPGKTLDGQHLTIIQHPSGERKQLAIRENQLLQTLENFLQYATDTAPGSSGSCVFNDLWQVVALHHSGVPATDDQGRWLTTDGSVWDQSMGDERVKWIANEGVRISSVIGTLAQRSATHPLVADLLARVTGQIKEVHPEPQPPSVVAVPADAAPPSPTLVKPTPGPQTDGAVAVVSLAATRETISIDPDYDNRAGYNASFLGTGNLRVPLPAFQAEWKARLEPLLATKTSDDNHPPHVLTYHHYSVVMNKERRLAFFTAVNIDGSVSFRLKRDPDSWILDPRIDAAHQIGEELYTANDFDRGHLVRRLDPAWGETRSLAKVANDDTFHFTNCSPQHKKFNEGKNLWAGVEDHILNFADENDLKLTVITGPVFRDDDAMYRGLIPIPREFWKVVAFVRPDRTMSATAFLVSQESLVANMEDLELGPFKTYQVPVADIESRTHLDFARLRQFDPLAAHGPQESSSPARVLRSHDEIVL